MEKHRAIPAGYMTVGEVAKKMDTTVRTLQYYDKEGVLSPSSESEGGRRLYTYKDIIKLHQIQSMKYLGFSLDDIKNRLVSLDTPEQVTAVLKEQASEIRGRINALTEVLSNLETLTTETEQMKTVDWHKYADIVAILRNGLKEHWAIKYFDGKILDRVRNMNEERGAALAATWKHLIQQVMDLKKEGMPPESPQGHAFAKEFWDYITEFTGGDMTLLPELLKFEETIDGWDEEWKTAWENASDYIQPALGSYFQSIGYNPFEGVENNDSNE